MAMARRPFSTATQMVTYPIGTISEQLACRRNNALVASLAGPPHDATASGPTSAGIAPARPPGRLSHGSATLGPRPPVHGPVAQRRPKDCPAVSPARSLPA